MTDTPVIGFIGLGYMGHGMAANVLKAGYTLYVKGNRNRAPIDDLVAQGAKEAATPREMAQACDIIHLCLSNSAQVEAVFHGDDGLLAGARQGLIVIDATTADPVSTLALSALLAEKGGEIVDAPLGRTPKEAEEGTLDTMVGGTDAAVAKAMPLIECWAANITRTGPVGTGHKMKLLMNFTSMGYAALYSEAITLAAKSGLSPDIFNEVIGKSRLSNGFFETFMRGSIGGESEIHKFTIANAAKDLRYADAMATQAGVVNLLGSTFKQYFTHAEAKGHSQEYVVTMARHIAALNGIDLEKSLEEFRA
ncbi:NAD(P)-dependent oxidoreductase [Celeribacter arenosi]|uniref:NAD(P)-dependent oxidoreductase n=1 Tax=Celeribacter arenosi TaxID=792649 RepID=A0ABP7JVA0_9RHOB